jgi:lysophospholipase L1-like esterase
MSKVYTYLALGDSYTIGESETLHFSFPYKTVKLLRKKNLLFTAPEILAKTGWTTHDLLGAMSQYPFLPNYDVITLLIGVNNQYQGKTVEEYSYEFESILKQAIHLVSKSDNLFVLSIPDYAQTPFAHTLDQEKITREIDLFNSANKALSLQYKVQYLNITPDTRLAASHPELLAADQLHFSAKTYEKWAELLTTSIGSQLK